ncbi:hypothetical protein [Stackebrandtia nassauensis]|uniref:Secreted protein n=1 Tax=Stackebrandtia nassauensis (strain DSM 44728 / CIP 108903 / NRRL B-16338 / NBRC 102104 / LLR-40K-21) TaxID=446470 RepID=D3Q038_STANL|nr:hypothetical protein [Stackebrandtia nassauensis]ADD45567.1 hypothetical protein Snas_5940 [Stackebrandtia nassauensis DSM 44728]
MRGRITGVLAAVSLALALTLTGCGGSDDTGSQGESAADKNHEKALKYAKCMREHGVDMEDPEPGEGLKFTAKGGDPKVMEKAQKACEKYQPQGNKGGKGDAKQKEKMLDYSKCMRDNGVEDFPDPTDKGMMIDKDVAEDPDFEDAQKACEKHMPGMGD